MSYLGASSQSHSDQNLVCPRTPKHKPLRGYQDILENFEDGPVYEMIANPEQLWTRNKKKIKQIRKTNMPKKSIIEFLDYLASES